MAARVITGFVGIVLFVGVCLWGSDPFSVGTTVLAAGALWELHRAFRSKGIRPNVIVSILGLIAPAWPVMGALGIGAPAIVVFGHAQPLFSVLAVGLVAGMCWEVIRAGRTGDLSAARNLAYGLLCCAYVSLFGGLSILRTQDIGRQYGAGLLARGVAPVLLTAVCVWAADSFAFFVGRAWGKQKLAPALSPAKSIEGFAGGLAGAAIVGAAAGGYLLQNPAIGLGVGLVAGVVGPIGDLFESAIKREIGIKDLGSVMPGHGGVLDRFDSLLFVAPLVALLFARW